MMRYRYIPIQMAEIQKNGNTKAGEDIEQEISFTDNSGKPLLIFVQFITKLNIVLTCNLPKYLSNQFENLYQHKTMHKNFYSIFIFIPHELSANMMPFNG